MLMMIEHLIKLSIHKEAKLVDLLDKLEKFSSLFQNTTDILTG